MEEYKTLIWEKKDNGIGVLTLNRPEAYNSVNQDVLDDLYAFWTTRHEDFDTAVIVLKAEGKGFCAGLDINWLSQNHGSSDMSPVAGYAWQGRLGRVTKIMREAPQPIIACVHGAAVGLGFSMMLASDIRVMSDDAKGCAGYINVGFGGADMGCSYLLPRLIGAGRAYEFMYTGAKIPAQELYDLGLVSKVVPKDQLFETGMQYAETLASKNHFGLRVTKEALNISIDCGSLEAAINMEDRNQTMLSFVGNVTRTI